MSKIVYTQEVQALCTDLAKVSERMTSMFSAYFDRGYNNGGSDPITDGDLTTLGVTAAEVAAFVTLAEQFNNFLNNQVALQSDYDDTVNDLRTDI